MFLDGFAGLQSSTVAEWLMSPLPGLMHQLDVATPKNRTGGLSLVDKLMFCPDVPESPAGSGTSLHCALRTVDDYTSPYISEPHTPYMY
jgi:hypothetical protein